MYSLKKCLNNIFFFSSDLYILLYNNPIIFFHCMKCILIFFYYGIRAGIMVSVAIRWPVLGWSEPCVPHTALPGPAQPQCGAPALISLYRDVDLFQMRNISPNCNLIPNPQPQEREGRTREHEESERQRKVEVCVCEKDSERVCEAIVCWMVD